MPVRRFVFSRSTWWRNKEKPLYSATFAGLKWHFYRLGFPHLNPLGAVVVGRRPGVCLSLLIQSCKLRVPCEGIDAPCAVRAGGWKLPIWDQARLHSQRLWTTCRVWMNCESKADGKVEGEKAKRTERGVKKHPKKRQINSPFIHLKKIRNIKKNVSD